MLNEAKWIWIDEKWEENSYGEFYFQLRGKETATIKLSCDGDYTLFINGEYVSSNQYGDFEYYKSVDEIDITPFLTSENNHIAILVWHFGTDIQRYKKYLPGLIFEIERNGKIVILSDENVLSRKSRAYLSGSEKIISSQLGYSFTYVQPNEDLWKTGEKKGFKKSVIVDKKCTFVKRPNKRLRLGDFIEAKPIYEHADSVVFDLGREYVGLLSFEIKADGEEKINISYGEHLEDCHVKRLMGNRDFSVDYISTRGKNKLTSYMLRLACRYLEVNTKSIEVLKIGLIPQYYEVKATECDFLEGEELEIYNSCVRTLELCMMEHYVDCPWREQCLYGFDSRNQMLSGYYAFEGGNYEYAKANLLLFANDRRDDGLLSICAPCGVDFAIPSFSLHYIVACMEYIEHSRDVSVINEVGTKLLSIIDAYLKNMKHGLISRFIGNSYWNFYDWSDYSDGYGSQKDIFANALSSLLFVYALNAYKRICDIASLPFEYSEKLCQIKKRVKEEFYIKEKCAFIMDKESCATTELVNAFAILTDTLDKEEQERACTLLTQGKLISSSLSMKCFIYDALLKVDTQKYKKWVLDDIKKNYLPMIKTGTVWETCKGESDFDGAGSLCHGWSSTPIYYYHLLKK